MPAFNWLRVLGPTERSQVDHRVCYHLYAIMPLLDTFKSEPPPLEFVLPRKGPLDPHASRGDGGVEQPLPSALGQREVRQDKCLELWFSELDRNRRRCRLWGNSTQHAMALWEK
jgi:hypothetical protein